MAPQSGHVSNFGGRTAPMIEPVGSVRFQRDRYEAAIIIHDRHAVRTRTRLKPHILTSKTWLWESVACVLLPGARSLHPHTTIVAPAHSRNLDLELSAHRAAEPNSTSTECLWAYATGLHPVRLMYLHAVLMYNFRGGEHVSNYERAIKVACMGIGAAAAGPIGLLCGTALPTALGGQIAEYVKKAFDAGSGTFSNVVSNFI